MLNRTSLYISLVLLLFSCSSSKKTQELATENPRPDWIMQKPISSAYYYGLGNANLRVHTTEFQSVAKNKALEDMASEIEVSIDAQSVLRQKETNQSFIENYEATTKIDVRNNIQDYEAVESWHNDSEYWVLYRLNKSEYKRLEQERKNKAISKSIHYLDLSDEENDYKLNFEYLLQALDAIKPYLNYPLEVERNNEALYLGNYILSLINNELSELKLSLSNKNVQLEWSNCFSSTITYSLQHNNIPVANMPIRVKFNSYAAQKLIADNDGFIMYNINAEYYENLPDQINAWIKTSDMIKDPIIAAFYEKEYGFISLNVGIKKPTVYINTTQGQGTLNKIVEKAKAKVSLNSENAEINIKVDFKVKPIGQVNDFYTSSCAIQMDIYDNNNTLIEQKIWPSVKGVHTDRMSANNKAIENALKQVKYSWIQKLIMEHCNE